MPEMWAPAGRCRPATGKDDGELGGPARRLGEVSPAISGVPWSWASSRKVVRDRSTRALPHDLRRCDGRPLASACERVWIALVRVAIRFTSRDGSRGARHPQGMGGAGDAWCGEHAARAGLRCVPDAELAIAVATPAVDRGVVRERTRVVRAEHHLPNRRQSRDTRGRGARARVAGPELSLGGGVGHARGWSRSRGSFPNSRASRRSGSHTCGPSPRRRSARARARAPEGPTARPARSSGRCRWSPRRSNRRTRLHRLGGACTRADGRP